MRRVRPRGFPDERIRANSFLPRAGPTLRRSTSIGIYPGVATLVPVPAHPRLFLAISRSFFSGDGAVDRKIHSLSERARCGQRGPLSLLLLGRVRSCRCGMASSRSVSAATRRPRRFLWLVRPRPVPPGEGWPEPESGMRDRFDCSTCPTWMIGLDLLGVAIAGGSSWCRCTPSHHHRPKANARTLRPTIVNLDRLSRYADPHRRRAIGVNRRHDLLNVAVPAAGGRLGWISTSPAIILFRFAKSFPARSGRASCSTKRGEVNGHEQEAAEEGQREDARIVGQGGREFNLAQIASSTPEQERREGNDWASKHTHRNLLNGQFTVGATPPMRASIQPSRGGTAAVVERSTGRTTNGLPQRKWDWE